MWITVQCFCIGTKVALYCYIVLLAGGNPVSQWNVEKIQTANGAMRIHGSSHAEWPRFYLDQHVAENEQQSGERVHAE